jgi:pectate lyase
MRAKRLLAVLVGLSVAGVIGVPVGASAGGDTDGLSWGARFFGRQVLPANDGWAAEGAGTTGGSAADADHVFVVENRAELVAALGGDNPTNGSNATPKLIYVKGTIEGNVDDANQPLSCVDMADPEYSLEAFLATYDPAVWGRVNPSGPVEQARVRSAANQQARSRINIGSNTTIIGLRGAHTKGVFLRMDGVSNVIIRNLLMEDSHDCFPAWAPNDGALGNWNSSIDNIWVRNSNHVWVDHNTFTDGDNPDSSQPIYFGRPFQVHDGQVDITNGSNFVTVSYNRFTNHDKTMLVGSTNTPGVDVGRLKVTLHHNMFDGVIQRAPRARFGQIDVYNNYYRVPVPEPFEYSWGVGVQSALYMENNYVALGAEVSPDLIVFDWGGTVMTELGTWVRAGSAFPQPMSLLEAYNAANDPDIGTDAGWTPAFRAGPVLPAPVVPVAVLLLAGAGRLPV